MFCPFVSYEAQSKGAIRRCSTDAKVLLRQTLAGMRLDQPEIFEARIALLAHDDVVMHEDSQRLGAATIWRVISMSARDGVGSPEG
jgi:hypothetical protein